jgi:hypothetical protein
LRAQFAFGGGLKVGDGKGRCQKMPDLSDSSIYKTSAAMDRTKSW